MAFFPQELLKCVTFVGYKDQQGEYHLAGSGFWVTRSDSHNIHHRLAYFVTAAHVIAKVIRSSADQRIWLRANTTDGGRTWYETPQVCWKHHPTDTSVDLAVLKIGIPNDLDHVAWPLESCVLKDSLDVATTGDRKIELGDELCFAGLFYPHKGEKKNIPIVRIGNVSALRDEPVLSRDGVPMDLYLVESRSIGGLSGSPVFIDIITAKNIHPPTHGFFAAAYAHDSPTRFKLFGVIHGHFGDDLESDAIANDGQRKVGVNLGIAMVIPAEKIHEILTQFDDEERQESRNRSSATPGSGPGIGGNSTIGMTYSPPKRGQN